MIIKTLADITLHHLNERPDEVAMVFDDEAREWTYRQLDTEACQCANALIEMKVGVGTRVAYLDKNRPEYFTLLFGLAKLNAVSVAVNWRLAPLEMEYIINHSESTVLVVGEDFLPFLSEMKLNLSQVVVLGDPGESPYQSYEQWIHDQPTDDPKYPADPSDTCYQLYTSGTTGLPKGVETTHRNMLSLMDEGLDPIQITEHSVNLVCLPLFHISGSAWGVLGFYTGCTSVLLKEANMSQILKVIPDYKVSHTIFVPAIMQFLLDQPNIDDVDFSSLQCVLYGASPISQNVLERAMLTFKANFFQVYGLTETTGGVTMLLAEDHDPNGPRAHLLRSCGPPVFGHEIKIVDTESSRECSDNEVGEIWVRGPQIMRGYWRNPQATKESIDEEGWFKSGDLGYLLDGYLFIHDRLKDMIISGGENIYPAEVENVLMKHPEVKDAAVIGVPDDKWGESVKAIVTRVNQDLDEETIFSFCRKNLAGYKCPTSIDWMDEIPRNPSGKILKVELRKPFWQGRDRNVS
ncbi:MAG: long-chain acyl-CoA synthetase [Candidatus Azotimanducaceae bacterium]|jgi:long-chain acyl-CoA synthetase